MAKNDPNAMHNLVKEVQQMEKIQKELGMCGISWVQPKAGTNGKTHAMTIIHICNDTPHDSNKPCTCWCGATALTAK